MCVSTGNSWICLPHHFHNRDLFEDYCLRFGDAPERVRAERLEHAGFRHCRHWVSSVVVASGYWYWVRRSNSGSRCSLKRISIHIQRRSLLLEVLQLLPAARQHILRWISFKWIDCPCRCDCLCSLATRFLANHQAIRFCHLSLATGIYALGPVGQTHLAVPLMEEVSVKVA